MRTLLILLTVACAAQAQGIWSTLDFGVTVRALATEVRIKEPVVPVSLSMPEYPADLARARIAGDASVRLLVSEDGSVREVEIVAVSQREFRAPVVEAVSRWKFQAYTPDGKQKIQKRVWMRCRILFRCDEE